MVEELTRPARDLAAELRSASAPPLEVKRTLFWQRKSLSVLSSICMANGQNLRRSAEARMCDDARAADEVGQAGLSDGGLGLSLVETLELGASEEGLELGRSDRRVASQAGHVQALLGDDELEAFAKASRTEDAAEATARDLRG